MVTKLMRGFSWYHRPAYSRAANRYGGARAYALDDLGFRVMRRKKCTKS